MGARSTAREATLLSLFAGEAGLGDQGCDERLAAVFRDFAAEAAIVPEEETRLYAFELARGIDRDAEKVDGLIRAASQNWRLERMSRVDRNVLRIGAFELVTGIPRAVAIDEAVELAKRYGTSDSGAFVNGILERIANDLGAG